MKTGNYRIDGVFSFRIMTVGSPVNGGASTSTSASNDMLEMIMANVDYRNSKVTKITDQELNSFNDTISSIPPKFFTYNTSFAQGGSGTKNGSECF